MNWLVFWPFLRHLQRDGKYLVFPAQRIHHMKLTIAVSRFWRLYICNGVLQWVGKIHFWNFWIHSKLREFFLVILNFFSCILTENFLHGGFDWDQQKYFFFYVCKQIFSCTQNFFEWIFFFVKKLKKSVKWV